MDSFLKLKKYAYVIALFIVYSGWLTYMSVTNSWVLFADWWQMSVTMLFGSFVAGATPTGGGAVAYPVFTKLLHISSADSRTFGMMIQSFGMTAAAIYIWSRGTRVLWRVIFYTSIGGFSGITLASFFLHLPDIYARVLFTTMISIFALALLYSVITGRRLAWQQLIYLTGLQKAEFILLGFLGGIIAENTGSGVDLVLFMTLTLCYRMEEKVSVPTSVIVMALSSIYGFALHGVIVKDIANVIPYWLVCIPVVIVGAPFGAWIVCHCKRWQLVTFVCLLILADLISTLVFLEFSTRMQEVIGCFVAVCGVGFSYFLWRGNRRGKQYQDYPAALTLANYQDR
ncbi:sulfite exporter TauE/SafE family protein [Teredinibacter waterburyi]|jgi:Predicted permeases|uniref:sulfite exporter TauE/SafE family protein n=1 Tax=Teredinibacter waterburyi TaxID=1500538 RepID=UPI00165F81B0|nr:sulfite exporter TauE/SafE family protein [Teredinibacter waterburyi]